MTKRQPVNADRPADSRRAYSSFSACPLCRSDDLEYEFIVDKFPLSRCLQCSLLFLNPQPGRSITHPTPGDSMREREVLKNSARTLMRYTAVKRIAVVGVGAETEFELELQDGQSADFFSIDRIDEAKHGCYDACILQNVLSKCRDPHDMIRSLKATLQEDGYIFVTEPSVDSPEARRKGAGWSQFNLSNLFYFNVNTLQNMLLLHGFSNPLVFSDPVSDAEWSAKDDNVGNEQAISIIMQRKHQLPIREKLSIIVPVFNEVATFRKLIERVIDKEIEDVEIEIIIVESNSNDGTREAVLEYRDHPRIKLVFEDGPNGKGHAVRMGLRHATGTIIMFQDADLEYDVDDYESLLRPIQNFQQNFVIGSRHNVLGKAWKIRNFSDAPIKTQLFNFGHVIFLQMLNTIYGQSLEDPFSMFKVFRKECLYGLTFECKRFDFDFEIVIKLVRKGYIPIEIPVNYDSRSTNEGKKVTMIRDPLTWLRALSRFRRSPLYARG